MTIDERIARLEHYTAGLDEQSRKDREENRQLWRDTQRTLNEFIERTTRSHEQLAEQLRQFQAEVVERDRETDRRFRETDARIESMVSAIGEFIRKQSK
jgi:rubrerythrin